jgi:hypothetical protein
MRRQRGTKKTGKTRDQRVRAAERAVQARPITRTQARRERRREREAQAALDALEDEGLDARARHEAGRAG